MGNSREQNEEDEDTDEDTDGEDLKPKSAFQIPMTAR